MSMPRFTLPSVTGIEESSPPLSDSGKKPPDIYFTVDANAPTRMTANPPGAAIECLMCTDTEASVVRITTAPPFRPHLHIADVTVRTGEHVGHEDLTSETILIASALYWSWWRAGAS